MHRLLFLQTEEQADDYWLINLYWDYYNSSKLKKNHKYDYFLKAHIYNYEADR